MILKRKIIKNLIKKKEKLEHKVYFIKNAKCKKSDNIYKEYKVN